MAAARTGDNEANQPGFGEVRSIKLVPPVVTFVLGGLAQTLLQEYISSRDSIKLGLLVVALGIGSVIIVLGLEAKAHHRALRSVHQAIQAQAAQTALALAGPSTMPGLKVEYVDDAGVGSSYRRAADGIRSATSSLTFVDLWEPFEGYQAETDNVIVDETQPAREDFYREIHEAVERHVGVDNIFHRRVVQVPSSLLESRIPFEVDPPFKQYLETIAVLQSRYPLACKLRIAPVLIRTHFIIVDQRIIILPILSHDAETQEQRRYGALFFDDTAKSLYGCLRHMYQIIESRSRPLTLQDLV